MVAGPNLGSGHATESNSIVLAVATPVFAEDAIGKGGHEREGGLVRDLAAAAADDPHGLPPYLPGAPSKCQMKRAGCPRHLSTYLAKKTDFLIIP